MKKFSLVFGFVGLAFIIFSGCSKSIEENGFAKKIDKLNPVGTEFPGGRGADELVVYTNSYGDRTGTNSYGIEVEVIDNMIKSVGGNNLKIPENGFIISAHGSNLKWISEKLFPGYEVFLEDSILRFSYTNNSKIYFADYLMKEANEIIEDEMTHESISMKRISGLKDEVMNLKKSYDDSAENSDHKNSRIANEILDLAHDIYYGSFPSFNNETRACWYRLREKSSEELDQTLKRMKEIGFNTICPEVIYGGYSIYPNAHKDLEQNPNFVGWDPMKELEILCEKYNIKLIPWVWVFFVGRENSPLVESKHEWLAISRQNEIPARSESNYHFFCPSRKEVGQFWIDVYKNMVRNYKIDGLQLDYIRYPVSLPNEYGYCYCDVCVDNFKKQYGVSPLDITEEDNPELWQKWIDYRVEQVTAFVGKVSDLLHSNGNNIPLSADVFPLFEESINFKFQDWGSWLRKGYLDEIFTMSYKPDVDQVKYESEFLVQQLPEGKRGIVGLGPFMGFRPEILVKEIYVAQKAGADGICLFSYGSLKPEQINALEKGPFRIKTEM